MPEEWMPVAYASVIVNGLDLHTVPEERGMAFFNERSLFNRFSGSCKKIGSLGETLSEDATQPGFRQRQRTQTGQVLNEKEDGVTFASIFDARLSALNTDGRTGVAIGPYSVSEDLNILFAPGINAVAFDLYQMADGLKDITVSLFDMSDHLIAAKEMKTLHKGGFFGAIDHSNLIGRISLHANFTGRAEGSKNAAPDLGSIGQVANDNPEPAVQVLFSIALASLGVARRSGSAVAHLESR
ncbi:hypothetical protein [Denitrobaculum tricleocarpae]|uniref:Uncharacterized protein n=1 Tax=Denitrobaculum tricleocarpae TaxID=2591009 RepID=A0A545U150_9PROT|nr:hypothetical protein [Denitrobaculum tricleocarpae]TQV83195.1 hypothetical protein FKG95_00930 [Denitrobaculum tricleocarpae]